MPRLSRLQSESSERFRVRLSFPLGGALLETPSETIVEIVDNDAGLEVEASQVTVREGVDHEVAFVVRRNSDGPETLQVDFATVAGPVKASSAP